MKTIISNNQKSVEISDAGINIIVDALLHEMERYNQAIELVSDTMSRAALNEARHKVYEVFTLVNKFTYDPEV